MVIVAVVIYPPFSFTKCSFLHVQSKLAMLGMEVTLDQAPHAEEPDFSFNHTCRHFKLYCSSAERLVSGELTLNGMRA